VGRKAKGRRESGAAAPVEWPSLDYDAPLSEVDFDPELVARAYLDHEQWAFSYVCDLQWNHPDACFALVKLALPLCRDDKERAYLAAGALESMLGSHGERMITAVEAESRRDPAFKRLLTGVWQHGMSDDLYARVLVASGRESQKAAKSR
jgi:hypothetical protein